MKTAIIYKITLRGSKGATRFTLDKKKMILGSHSSCDIQLIEETISSYHAFICIQGEEGIIVKDLCSEQGVFVNGSRIQEAVLFSGDTISVGQCHFVIESSEEDAPLFDLDDTLKVLPAEEYQYVQYGPNLQMIDGEWCDITFDDSGYTPLSSIPQITITGKHIELDEKEHPLELSQVVNHKCLEIISYINGCMSEVRYVDLKNGDYFLSNKTESQFNIPFHTLNTKLFSIKKGKLSFIPNESLTPSSDWDKISLNEAFFVTHFTEQVSLRLIDRSFSWKRIPTFYREKDFIKQSTKIFASLFLPLLILLFVTIPNPEPLKPEVAIIYTLKKAVEATENSEHVSTDVTQSENTTANKSETSEIKKVELAEASQAAASSTEAAPRKKAPQITPQKMPEKVIAETTPVSATPVTASISAAANGTPMPSAEVARPTPAPAKPYNFKSKSIDSLMGGGPSLAAVGSGTGKNSPEKTFGTGRSDKGDLMANANIGISKLSGSDSTGSADTSYGSRGVASKKGFDSASLEPGTVIRGSMDPELLRKILREYIPQFRHCYQKELSHHTEKINGIIEMNFTINAFGKATKHDIRMKDAKFSGEGVNCMVNVLNIIDFPRPKGGGIVDVKQPLNFHAETSR